MSQAWLRGKLISDDELLAAVGPGLAAAADAAPIRAFDWNAFAFVLGRRLLAAYAHQPGAKQHVIEICATALATIAAVEAILETGEPGFVSVLAIEATLHPMTMFAGSSAVELLFRVFRWGTRRVRRDRRLHDSLADLARAAVDVHAELAARVEGELEVARELERAAQRADLDRVLAGQAALLVSAG